VAKRLEGNMNFFDAFKISWTKDVPIRRTGSNIIYRFVRWSDGKTIFVDDWFNLLYITADLLNSEWEEIDISGKIKWIEYPEEYKWRVKRHELRLS
jgi:hypothetical protein